MCYPYGAYNDTISLLKTKNVLCFTTKECANLVEEPYELKRQDTNDFELIMLSVLIGIAFKNWNCN